MATVSVVVYDHHKKTDGTYNVKIRVFHKNQKKLIDTTHFVMPYSRETIKSSDETVSTIINFIYIIINFKNGNRII